MNISKQSYALMKEKKARKHKNKGREKLRTFNIGGEQRQKMPTDKNSANVLHRKALAVYEERQLAKDGWWD